MKKIYIPLIITLFLMLSLSIMMVSANDEDNPDYGDETDATQSDFISSAPRSITQVRGDFIEDRPPPPTKKNFSSSINMISQINGGVFYEDFEGQMVPPTGWSEKISNTNYNWSIGTPYNNYASYFANVEYDPTLTAQDEWLLSPVMTISEGILKFMSTGSTYWCRDTLDNCDLNVWIVVGNVGGGDDIFLGKADDDWMGLGSWSQSIFDLTSIWVSGPARIGFQYVGSNGAQVGLDNILLDTGLKNYIPLTIKN